MTNAEFRRYTHLEYRLRHAEQKVASFESGDEYRKLNLGNCRIRNYYERNIRFKDREIARLHREIVDNRKNWFQVFEDLQKEEERRIRELERIIEKKDATVRKKDEKIKELQKKLSKKMDEVIEERAKTNEEKEKNQKLQAQVNQNFQNSSTPSSQDSFRDKVPNNRIATGRKKGAQPGHEGHRRKALPVTNEPVFIEAPDEIKNNPDYYIQSGPNSTVRKQVVGIRFSAVVTEYWAYQYRNRKTRAKYHAPFPEGVSLDVNYDKSVKAVVFLLRNHLNVSIDKTREFLSEMTGGMLNISHGKISEINEEFAQKTKPEQDAIFASLAAAEVMYTDMTSVRHNGKLKNVVVCSDKKNLFYAFRDKKGFEGLKGTPVELFVGLLSHDHDKTFFHYGSRHQSCNVHHLRYLLGSSENEPGLGWHTRMRSLLLEMNSTREKQGRVLEASQIKDFMDRYDAILEQANREYYDSPPSKYYRKGFNLYKELRDYKDAALCFLTNPNVDFSNNEAERCGRKIKRRAVISGSFRGDTNRSGEDYCKAMSVLQTDRRNKTDIYMKIQEYFKRIAVINPGEKKKKHGEEKKGNNTEAKTQAVHQ